MATLPRGKKKLVLLRALRDKRFGVGWGGGESKFTQTSSSGVIKCEQGDPRKWILTDLRSELLFLKVVFSLGASEIKVGKAYATFLTFSSIQSSIFTDRCLFSGPPGAALADCGVHDERQQ